MVNELDLNKHVFFLGPQHHNKIPELLSTHEIFAFPTECESFGMVAIESMAMGLPVVVPDIPPFKEFIENGVDGLIVPLTPEGFAEGIRNILTDEELRKRLSKNAVKKAKNFTCDNVVMQLEEIMWSLIQSK